jgi:dipeptidyl aminopeptidase/acylaminoacyl peptidase
MWDYSRPHYSVLDVNIEGGDWRKLQGFVPGAVGSLASRTSTAPSGNRTWVVRYSADNATTRYFLHGVDSGAWPPQLLFDEQPALVRYTLANMHPVVFSARDGLTLPGYVSLPVRPGVPRVLPECVTGVLPDAWPADKGQAAAPLKCPLGLKLPMVLLVHGGPWSR